MTIRHAHPSDADRLAEIEEQSFPPAEAADKECIRQRLAVFPECFWLLEDDGRILAIADGLATNELNLADEMYFNSAAHDKAGDWQMLFSVATAPEARGRGFASRLLKEVIADCESRGRKGIVLTCKQHLIEFYARFGFKNEGVSQSIHGGARWYQMKLEF